MRIIFLLLLCICNRETPINKNLCLANKSLHGAKTMHQTVVPRHFTKLQFQARLKQIFIVKVSPDLSIISHFAGMISYEKKHTKSWVLGSEKSECDFSLRALSNHYLSLSAIEQKRCVHFKYGGTLKNKGKQIYLWSISFFIFNFQRFQILKTKIAAYCPFGHAATEGFAYAINDRRSWRSRWRNLQFHRSSNSEKERKTICSP